MLFSTNFHWLKKEMNERKTFFKCNKTTLKDKSFFFCLGVLQRNLFAACVLGHSFSSFTDSMFRQFPR